MPSKSEVLAIIASNLASGGSPKITAAKHRAVEEMLLNYADNNFKLTSVSGSTITDSRMLNRDVNYLIIDDAPKNTGWVKPTNGQTLTFTDGTVLFNSNVSIQLM